MQRVYGLTSFAADLQKFVHVFDAIHLLDIGGNYIIEAGILETLRAQIGVVTRIKEVTAQIGGKWNLRRGNIRIDLAGHNVMHLAIQPRAIGAAPDGPAVDVLFNQYRIHQGPGKPCKRGNNIFIGRAGSRSHRLRCAGSH